MKLDFSSKLFKKWDSIKLKDETSFYPCYINEEAGSERIVCPRSYNYPITDIGLLDSKVKTSHFFFPLHHPASCHLRQTSLWISYLWHWRLPSLPDSKGQKHWYCSSQAMKFNTEPQILPTRTLPLETKSSVLGWCPFSISWIFATPQLATYWVSQQAITQLQFCDIQSSTVRFPERHCRSLLWL